MYNKGTKALIKGEPLKALAFFKKQIKIREFKELYTNMGNAYKMLGDDLNATVCYTKANDKDLLDLNGKGGLYPLALNNLGQIEYSFGRDTSAIECYLEAIKINDNYADTKWNLSHSVLRMAFNGLHTADEDIGWKLYEYRFLKSVPVDIEKGLPWWDGVSCGLGIVVLTEQGMGDKLMFGRYIHLLKKYFKKVVVQCHPDLDCFFSDFETCRFARETDCTTAVPICSLAKHFGSRIPGDWLAGKFPIGKLEGAGLKIGCVWSGSKTHANDHYRSCLPTEFLRFSKYGTLYSLNPEARKIRGFTDISSMDWNVTAANLLDLDVLISVDTSIVHFAGSLGVPCLMLMPYKAPDFRWPTIGSDSYWYKSVKLIQNNRNWEKTFLEAETCVKALNANNIS